MTHKLFLESEWAKAARRYRFLQGTVLGLFSDSRTLTGFYPNRGADGAIIINIEHLKFVWGCPTNVTGADYSYSVRSKGLVRTFKDLLIFALYHEIAHVRQFVEVFNSDRQALLEKCGARIDIDESEHQKNKYERLADRWAVREIKKHNLLKTKRTRP